MEIPRVILQALRENGVGLDTGTNACRTAYLTNLQQVWNPYTVFWTLTFQDLGNLLKFQKWMTVCAAARGTGRQIMSGYNVLFDTRRSKQMADADQHPLSNFDRWSGSLLEISL